MEEVGTLELEWHLKLILLDVGGSSKKPHPGRMGLLYYAGDHLISHTLTRAVPSAQRGLTSVFGMGTGVTLVVNSPAKLRCLEGVYA